MLAPELSELLVRKGLWSIGGPTTIRELARQYGIRRWYGFWDVIYLPPSPLFAENTQPFFVQNDASDRLPPNTFHNDFDYLHDAERNHEFALDRLTQVFSQEAENTSVSNTWSHTWNFGEMSVNIQTFIREKTLGNSPLYQRHPELWNQCRITIERNWVWELSVAERRRLEMMESWDKLPFPANWAPMAMQPPLRERGLLRRMEVQSEPFFWRSPDRSQIGWHAGARAMFFDRAICSGLTLEQISPARGPGYSRVVLAWANPFSEAHERAETSMLNGEATHTLDEFAPRLAAFSGLDLKTVDYPDD